MRLRVEARVNVWLRRLRKPAVALTALAAASGAMALSDS